MLDWSAMRTVLLDMDGTILDLTFDNVFWQRFLPERYAQVHAMTLEEGRAELERRFTATAHTLAYYCLDHWNEATGLDIRTLKQQLAHLIRFRPHSEDFLCRLEACGIRRVLVTNAHPDVLSLKHEHTSVCSYFERTVTSHELEAPKETQAFWQALNEIEPFDPETTVLIDDNLHVLDSAQRFGIRHLVAIRQPDSQRDRREDLPYPAIDHFTEIMPSEVRE
jgi:HAD superfamily hydrolase (TIGR01509 family)